MDHVCAFSVAPTGLWPEALNLLTRAAGSAILNAMSRGAARATIALLLDTLDRAYDDKSWHGTGLRGSVRRLDARQAIWRPSPRRHCIADIVVHAAYWKYVVRRRFVGEKRGSFPIAGSNWFKLPARLPDAEWKRYVALLDDEHRRLRAVVAGLSPRELILTPTESKVSNIEILQGIAAHDLYHAGQIQFLKALQKG